jgi:hypothetical protein
MGAPKAIVTANATVENGGRYDDLIVSDHAENPSEGCH